MKVYYVDAENVGFNLPTELSVSVLDRIFVFTNNEKHIKDCKDSLLTIVSGYPTGANQADFHIIAHFVKIACHLSPVEKKALVFILCSKDVNLWKAFEFQCALVGVKSSNPFIDVVTEEIKALITAPAPVKVAAPAPIKAPEVKNIAGSVVTKEIAMTKIVNLLRIEAFSAAEITEKLVIQKELVAASLTELFRQKKIQRVSEDNKKWCLTA